MSVWVPVTIPSYLEVEQKNLEDSRQRYAEEIEIFSSLVALYEALRAGAHVLNDSKDLLPAALYLTVGNQLLGVVSQLLRCRVVDAEALTRRSIEATAIAYRAFEKPDRAWVFIEAYPHRSEYDHPDQWRPSLEYRREFSTRKLFSPDGETFAVLRRGYECLCAIASHAGPGALMHHEFGSTTLYAGAFAEHGADIVRAWLHLLRLYGEMWKVFVNIFRAKLDAPTLDGMRRDFDALRDRAARLKAHRLGPDASRD
jgi:hypothetical protein